MRFVAAAGVRVLDDKLLIGPELLTQVPLEAGVANGSATEVELGAHYALGRGLDLGVGVGLGIVNGIGSPDHRGLLSLAWSGARSRVSRTARPVTPPRPLEETARAPAPFPSATEVTVTMNAPPPDVRADEPEATAPPPGVLLDARIHFALDRADILSTQDSALLAVLAVLRAHPDQDANVEGHADESGTRVHNADLSTRRARAVARWLIARGIPATRLRTIGFGADVPRDPDGSWSAHAVNRRVELRLLPVAEQPR